MDSNAPKEPTPTPTPIEILGDDGKKTFTVTFDIFDNITPYTLPNGDPGPECLKALHIIIHEPFSLKLISQLTDTISTYSFALPSYNNTHATPIIIIEDTTENAIDYASLVKDLSGSTEQNKFNEVFSSFRETKGGHLIASVKPHVGILMAFLTHKTNNSNCIKFVGSYEKVVDTVKQMHANHSYNTVIEEA